MAQTNKKRKALLLENINPAAKLMLEKTDFEVETINNSLTTAELIKKIANVEILGIRSKTKIEKQLIKKAKQLKALGVYCVGTDQIDLTVCRQANIEVINDPFSNTRSVAELVVGAMIVLLRRLTEKNKLLHEGHWQKLTDGYELRGKTLGIIGYGRIGSQLSVIAENLGMRVIFYDKEEKLAYGRAEKCQNLETLLPQADVISVHVDGRPENKQLIGKRELLLMKTKAILINTSRGFVVDIKALANCLIQGRIAGAAIDVFPDEPKNNQDVFIFPLQKLPNVLLTPHIGGNTIEAQEKIAQRVTNKIIEYLCKQ